MITVHIQFLFDYYYNYGYLKAIIYTCLNDTKAARHAFRFDICELVYACKLRNEEIKFQANCSLAILR